MAPQSHRAFTHLSVGDHFKAVAAAAVVPAFLLLVLGLLPQFFHGFSMAEIQALLMAAVVIAFPVSLFAVVVLGLPVAWLLNRFGWFRPLPVVMGGGLIGMLVFHLFIAYMASSFGGPDHGELTRRLLTWLAGAVAGSLSAWVYWIQIRRAVQ